MGGWKAGKGCRGARGARLARQRLLQKLGQMAGAHGVGGADIRAGQGSQLEPQLQSQQERRASAESCGTCRFEKGVPSALGGSESGGEG